MGDGGDQRFDDDGSGWIGRLADAVLRRPRLVLCVSAILAAVGGALGMLRLPLDADTNSLIGSNRPWMQEYRAFLTEFGDLEYLYVAVDTKGDRAAGEAAVDDLVTRLRRLPELPGLHGRVEPEEAWRIATRAMSEEELAGLVLARDGVAALAAGAGPDQALDMGNRMLGDLLRPGALGADPAALRREGAAGLFLLEAVAAGDDLVGGHDPAFGLAARPRANYLASETGRILFVEILPHKDFSRMEAIAEPLRRIRAVLAEVRAAHPAVEIGLTGKPVLQADELATSTGDTTRAFAGALALVAVLCVVMYRGMRRPLLALLAFLAAIGWTHGLASLLVGRLTLLSIVFMLVLVGAGLDYGIHIVTRYTECRATMDIRSALRKTMRTAGPGTVSGAATSAAVFLLALLADFQGLRELGIIAAAGLISCAVAMVTTLPALLALFDSPRPVRQPREIPLPGRSVGEARGPATVSIAVFAALFVAAAIAIPLGLRFENNLLKLQSPDLESVQWEHRILEDSASASWFAGVIVEDEAGIQRTLAKAKNQPEIGHVRSVFDVVRPTSPERVRDRAAFAAAVQNGVDAPSPSRASAPVTAAGLELASSRVRLLAGLAAAKAPAAEIDRMNGLALRLAGLAEAVRDPARDAAAQQAMAEAVGTAGAALRAMAAGDALALREALPAAARDRFVAPSGRFLVSLLPKEDAWEYGPLQAFVRAIRTVDPSATGVPITQSESIRDMFDAFIAISIYSVIAVAVIVWLDFRRLAAVVLCVSVLLVGIVLSLGVLAVTGVPLSLANFFGIPILIGLGIDSNIHLLHRADENRHAGDPRIDLGTTRTAVIFTSLTTAIGFGGQIFASHRGMAALGWIMFLGSLVCLATSVWLLPALLQLFRRRKIAHGDSDVGASDVVPADAAADPEPIER